MRVQSSRAVRAAVPHQGRLSFVQSQSCLTLCEPMDCSTPGFLSFGISQSFLKLMSIELAMPSNHLILCCPLLFLLSVFLSLRVFSSESALLIRWPKYWSFSFNISPSNHNKLKEMGIPDHLTCLMRNLYAGQEATVRTGHGTTDWFQIGKGVLQGCILSLCLLTSMQSTS